MKMFWDPSTIDAAIAVFQQTSNNAERNTIYTHHLHQPTRSLIQMLLAEEFPILRQEDIENEAEALLFQKINLYRPTPKGSSLGFAITILRRYFTSRAAEVRAQAASHTSDPFHEPADPAPLLARETREDASQLVSDIPLWQTNDSDRNAVLRALQALLIDTRWADHDHPSPAREKQFIQLIISADTGLPVETVQQTLSALGPEYAHFKADQD